ncbi:MAG: hypothetical protein JJ841_004760 [Prochlorococcus marinus CUG1432]|nr:hypothetical protein [Prochlorococcus marinus]MBO8230400.1 hypothetical protein [Prochlorococcus marinus XMU1404]MCR8545263.1 hypothetical protein [Prochlorococcus marinus CUG1432]
MTNIHLVFSYFILHSKLIHQSMGLQSPSNWKAAHTYECLQPGTCNF